MSLLYNLARMTCATVGAGALTLGSATAGALTFAQAGVADGDVVTYAIADGSQSEIGRGVWTAATKVLTRNVLRSTNGNAAINLSGASEVFITAAAEDFQRAGQCRLVKGGANLVLQPWDGNRVVVNDKSCIIPSAGVSLAPTGLTPGTTYYIYAVETNGVVTSLEPRAAVYAVDPVNGTKVKFDDATRALIGMARTIAGPAWQDTPAQRFVRSWFNDPGIACLNGLSVLKSTTSTTFIEVDSAARNEFLLWAGEVWDIRTNGFTQNTTVGQT